MAGRPRRGKYMPVDVTPSTSKSTADDEEEPAGPSSNDESEDDTRSGTGTGSMVGGQSSTSKKRNTKSRINYQEADDMEMDEEDDYFLPPPTPRVTLDRRRDTERDDFSMMETSTSYDVRRIASKLIHDCRTWVSDNRPADINFHQGFRKNIEEGKVAFERAIQGGGTDRRVGITNEVLLMLQHTKAASSVIRTKAELIGTGPVIFDMDSFLDSLKREYVDDNSVYSPTLAAANIAKECALGSSTVRPLVAVVGTYDRDAVVIQKPKRAEPVRRTQQDEEAQEGSTVIDGSNIVAENSPAENVAREMKKVLKIAHEQSSDPVNLYEFVMNRDSFPKTIENLFYFGFLVQDGLVSLVKEENGKMKDLSLNIKPEKSQKFKTKTANEGDGARNQTNRSTYILSFSPKQWQHLCSMAQGENTIGTLQSLIEAQQMESAG